MKNILIIFLLLFISCNQNKNFENGAVHFVSVNKVPVIEGTLNGKKTYFIVDSGASISVLDESQSDKYGFGVHVSQEPSEAAGYGGVARFKETSGVDIKVGGISFNGEYQAQDLTPIRSLISRNDHVTIAGIIGCNIMSRNGLILDFSKGVIYLSDYATVVSK